MKKIFLVLLAVGLTSRAFGEENNIRGLIGFNQSTVNIGGDFEHRYDSVGLGGYLNYSGEDKNVRHQTITFGGFAPVHVLDDRRVDVYLAPGFGIMMVKGWNGQNDETVFGPSLKIGLDYKMTRDDHLGIQFMHFTNWFDDKAASAANYNALAYTHVF